MTNAATSIYIAPDIRRQTLQEAEDFITQKRARRMVLLHTYKEKEKQRAEIVHAKELARFDKRAEMVKKALDNISIAIEKAERQLQTLNEINHLVNNVEGVIKDAL